MNIHHPAIKVGGDFEQREKAGKRHQIDLCLAQHLEHPCAELRDRCERTAGNNFAVQSGFLCPRDSCAVGSAGNYDGNFCVQRSIGNLLDEVHQRRATTGDEGTQPNRPVERFTNGADD